VLEQNNDSKLKIKYKKRAKRTKELKIIFLKYKVNLSTSKINKCRILIIKKSSNFKRYISKTEIIFQEKRQLN
jgi:hypothetical protein